MPSFFNPATDAYPIQILLVREFAIRKAAFQFALREGGTNIDRCLGLFLRRADVHIIFVIEASSKRFIVVVHPTQTGDCSTGIVGVAAAAGRHPDRFCIFRRFNM